MLRLLLRFMFFNTLLRRLKIKRSEGNGEIMNKLQGAFRSKLDADKKKNFADLDKTVKAERIAQNVQDPKSGDNTGYNKLGLTLRLRRTLDGGRCTAAQGRWHSSR